MPRSLTPLLSPALPCHHLPRPYLLNLWNNFSGRCTDYSSIWHAIAALRWIDECNGTDFYERCHGDWHEKVESGRATLIGSSKEESRELMRRALSQEYVDNALKNLEALIKIASSYE